MNSYFEILNFIEQSKCKKLKISDVLKVQTKYKSISKEQVRKTGKYPVIDQSQRYISGYSDEEILLLENDECIIFGDHTREIKFVNFNFIPGDSGVKVLKCVNPTQVCTKYIYYSMKNLEIPNRGYNRHWSVVSKMEIFLPPIEVQKKIVQIFDVFEKNIELEEEKQELNLLQKVYYRNKFIKIHSKKDIIELKQITMLRNEKNKKQLKYEPYSITQKGLIPTKDYFKEKTNITSQNTSNYYVVKRNWFVYSPSRIDVGSINYLKDEGPVIVSPIDVVFEVVDSTFSSEYLLNVFLSDYGMNQIVNNRKGIEGTGRKNLPYEDFCKIRVPKITMEEQLVFNSMIDKFNKQSEANSNYINYLKLQFKYYMKRLLSFKEVEVNE